MITKLKEFRTTLNLIELSSEQYSIRRDNRSIEKKSKRCNTCLILKRLSDFRFRTKRRGKAGIFYDAKCKECHARVRGTKEYGKLSFAKELIKKGFRRCGKCKNIMPLTMFHRNRAAHGGLMHQCKHCH